MNYSIDSQAEPVEIKLIVYLPENFVTNTNIDSL